MAEEVHFWRLVRDADGKIITWRLVDANPPTLKTWGRSSVEEIRGKTTDEIFGPGAAKHFMAVVQKVMGEGEPIRTSDYFPNLGKFFRFTTVPLGEYFITTGADITAIKKAEAALKESEERFRIIAETSPVSIAVSRASDGVLRYTNRTFDEMYGYGATKGKKAVDLYVNPADRAQILSLARQGLVKDYEVNVKRRDGSQFWVSSSVAKINYGGEPAFLIASIDVTERKKLDRAKDEFVSLVSHELRTPLTIVLGSLKTASTPGMNRRTWSS